MSQRRLSHSFGESSPHTHVSIVSASQPCTSTSGSLSAPSLAHAALGKHFRHRCMLSSNHHFRQNLPLVAGVHPHCVLHWSVETLISPLSMCTMLSPPQLTTYLGALSRVLHTSVTSACMSRADAPVFPARCRTAWCVSRPWLLRLCTSATKAFKSSCVSSLGRFRGSFHNAGSSANTSSV